MLWSWFGNADVSSGVASPVLSILKPVIWEPSLIRLATDAPTPFAPVWMLRRHTTPERPVSVACWPPGFT